MLVTGLIALLTATAPGSLSEAQVAFCSGYDFVAFSSRGTEGENRVALLSLRQPLSERSLRTVSLPSSQPVDLACTPGQALVSTEEASFEVRLSKSGEAEVASIASPEEAAKGPIEAATLIGCSVRAEPSRGTDSSVLGYRLHEQASRGRGKVDGRERFEVWRVEDEGREGAELRLQALLRERQSDRVDRRLVFFEATCSRETAADLDGV